LGHKPAMTYTALTAIVITFHNLSALSAVIITLILSTIIFLLFLRKSRRPFLGLCITIIITSFLSFILAEKFYHKNPVAFELVQAG
jgi:uncharacterized protein YybS (DUF2232 family)